MICLTARSQSYIPIKDKFGMLKFTSPEKKDAAYSLVYCYYLFKLLQALSEKGLDLTQIAPEIGHNPTSYGHRSNRNTLILGGEM